MKNTKFTNKKIWLKYKSRLQNLVLTFLITLIWLWSIVVFSWLIIPGSISNDIQIIKRIIISRDATYNILNRLYDISYNWNWKIKVYMDNISPIAKKDKLRASWHNRKILWIDMAADLAGWRDLIFIQKQFFNYLLSWHITTWSIGPQWSQWPQWFQWPQWITWLQWTTWHQWLQWPQWITWLQWTTWHQWEMWSQWLQWNIWIWTDNLWNHIAVNNIKMTSHYISNDWNPNQWISFDANNDLYILQDTITDGTITTDKTIQVWNDWISVCDDSLSWEIRFLNWCFQWCDWSSRVTFWSCSNTRIADCTWLPALNANRNTVSKITQYWNSNSRTPSTWWIYSVTGSVNECRFKCDWGYIYSWTSNTCIFNGRSAVWYSNDFWRWDAIDIKDNNIYIWVNYWWSISMGNILLTWWSLAYKIGIFKSNTDWEIQTGKKVIRPTTWSTVQLIDLKTDNNWNIYINWRLSWSMIYENNIILSWWQHDIFLIKLDNNFNLIWAKSTSWMSINLYHESLATDINWNIYIIWSAFVNTLTIDTLSLSNISQPFAFIAKFDQYWNILRLEKPYWSWRQEIDTSIKIDSYWNIIAWWSVLSNWKNIFISKLDQSWNKLRHTLFSNYHTANSWDLDSMSYDTDWNIYILSRPWSYNISKFNSGWILIRENSTPWGMSTHVYWSIMSDNNNIYICWKKIWVYAAKFNINWNILWSADAMTYNMSYCAESVIDASSNIYVIWWYANTYLNFDNTYYFTWWSYNVILMKIPAWYQF